MGKRIELGELNESHKKVIAKGVGQLEGHKILDESKIVSLIESEVEPGYELDEAYLDTYIKLIQLQESACEYVKKLNETNNTGNIADFIPRLQPLLRKVMPKLMAFDVCGIQPVKTPKSEVFMLKAIYSGSNQNPVVDQAKSRILQISEGTASDAIGIGTIVVGDADTVGTVVYKETVSGNLYAGAKASDQKTFIVVDYDNVNSATDSQFAVTQKLQVITDPTAGYGIPDASDYTIDVVYENEAGYRQILPGYTGPYNTADGEKLGHDMRQMAIRIVSVGVDTKTRAIKAELTVELIQDMKSMHGLSAEKEILFVLESELINDINMSIIKKFKEVSKLAPVFDLANDSAGRHAMEYYSGLYDRILADGRELGSRNQKGNANILIATSRVISALQSLGKFQAVNQASSLKHAETHADNYVGTTVDGMKVYQDWFADDEGYMVIYKGKGALDNGVIYAPYQPVMIMNATSSVTMQPVIAIKTRADIVGNTFYNPQAGQSAYATYRGVNFNATPLKKDVLSD